uniref:Uncharacterized protein n=1 Tax=Rhizophora mucronata TaxID=61149 RepID=A0A2P2PHZ9_RHIMU
MVWKWLNTRMRVWAI